MADLQQELLTVLNDIIGSVIDVAGNAGPTHRTSGAESRPVCRLRDPKHSLEIAGDILVEAHELVADSRRSPADLRHTSDEAAKLKEELLHARREAYVDVLTGLEQSPGVR